MSDPFAIAEGDRRLNAMMMTGHVVEVDHEARRAVVEVTDEWRLAPLPWLERRSGKVRTSSPPTVGEPCIVLSPGGETMGGVIMLGGPSDDTAPSETREGLELVEIEEGYSDRYDVESKTRAIAMPEEGKLTVAINEEARVSVEPEKIALTLGEDASVTVEPSKVELALGGVKVTLDDGKVTVKAANIVLDGETVVGGSGGGAAIARVGDMIDTVTKKILTGASKAKAV